MRKHSLQSAGSAILASVAVFLALVNAGAPAWAEVSGTLNQWTATAKIEQMESGEVEASVSFNDNGTGGTRRGGVILVTNLGLGSCETQDECSEKAVDRGLPPSTLLVSPPDPRGWWHYCVAAPTDDPHKRKSCWSRPGSQSEYGITAVNGPGTVLTKAHSPYGIAQLDDDNRDWTAIACLAGGTAPNGTVIGNPDACRLQIHGFYIYVIDRPVEVRKGR